MDVERNLDASVIKRSNIIAVEFSSHDRRLDQRLSGSPDEPIPGISRQPVA